VTRPQFLAIGHVTFDVSSEDFENRHPGGAVAFASVTASRMGIEPAIVTSCADDYPAGSVIETPERFVRVPSANTSFFENRYNRRGDRVQILHQRAENITRDHIPGAWLNPDMLFVGPLNQELPTDCLSWFNPRVSCVTPQGWLRSWADPLPSTVEVAKLPPEGMSRGWDICVVSESEFAPASIKAWRETCANLVVTKGDRGAELYSGDANDPFEVPSFAERVKRAGVDTTGAGDVFAAAMLIRYASTRDATASALYAAVCAALSTRAPSWSSVENPSLALPASAMGSGGTVDSDRSRAGTHILARGMTNEIRQPRS
jgi:sugar/nucleoside kinase (ribokinase family)